MSRLLALIVIAFMSAAATAQSSDSTSNLLFAQRFKTLEELDEALEAGEIAYEDYEELLDELLGHPYGDIELDSDESLQGSDTLAAVRTEVPQARIVYHGSFTQQFADDAKFVRYDKLKLGFGKFDASASLKQTTSGEPILRSRSLRWRHAGGAVTLGSYDLKIGEGLTEGTSQYPSPFRTETSFHNSLAYPNMNRNNGVLIEENIGKLRGRVFATRLEGDDFYRDGVGISTEYKAQNRSVGLVAMRQRMGRMGGGELVQELLAPYFAISNKTFAFSGESSIGIRGGSAHQYRMRVKQGGLEEQLLFFSEGRRYNNLQSGGYAYSDYEETRIDSIGLSYSDKRTGRVGASMTTSLKASNDFGATGTLVRWENKLDNRQCAAAKVSLAKGSARSGSLSRIDVVWENLDLQSGMSSRQWISVGSNRTYGDRIKFNALLKGEKRIRLEVVTYPLRARIDCEWKALRQLLATFSANYYVPNLESNKGRYLQFSIGEKLIQSKLVAFWVKSQARYHFDKAAIADWQLRIYCDITS